MHTSQRELSTSKLFSDAVQYKVPRYQRRYVWDKTNWRALSEDIFALLGLELEGDIDSDSGFDFKPVVKLEDTSTEKDKKHFTGIIATRQISDRDIEIFEVIDGQQRLTTFQIIFCVIRDIFESKDLLKQAEEPQNFIVNDPNVVKRVVNRTGEETTYKFCPTEFDIKEFEKIANRKYGETISLASDEESYRIPDEHRIAINNKFTNGDSHNILDTYYYFYSLTMAYIHYSNDWKHNLDSLLVTVKSQLKVLLTTLEESDHSEKIFESINATGRKLAEFDYLRNNLFLRTRQLDDGTDNGKSHVKKFYDKYWHFENTHSYWDAERLETFLRVFLKAKLGPSFGTNEENGKDRKTFEVYQQFYYKKVKEKAIIGNFDEYEEECSVEYNQIKYEFHELARYSNTYQYADPEAESDRLWHRIRRRMEFYNDLKMKNFLPFILHLRWEAKKSINELEMVLKILESYIVRRMVEHGYDAYAKDTYAYDTLDKFFLKLIRGREFDINEFVESLSEWPDDEIIFMRKSDEEFVESTRPGVIRQRYSTDGALQKIANDTASTNTFSAQDRAWSLIRYIFYRIENHINKRNQLRFEDFLSYEPTRIGSINELDGVLANWLSIGNLTFRVEDEEIQSTMVDNVGFLETKIVLGTPPNSTLELNKEICKEHRWNIYQHNRHFRRLKEYFCQIWPDQKSVLKEISMQTFKPDENLIKTYIGEIKFWGGSLAVVECSDFEKPIQVEYDDFKDTDDQPIQIGQKVKFEISPIQKSGKFLKGINMIPIE
ncbi:MAG: DUF262 domain-containing protein [Candidatus Poribacteria bacterium]|nr:DUF262 domain-containing protein [Candidatus Poribacteria bacterium]